MTAPNLEKFLALSINPDETFQGGIVGMSELLSVSNTNEDAELSLVLWRSVTTELVHADPLPPDLRNDIYAFIGVLIRLCSEHEFPFRPGVIECNDAAMTNGLRDLLSDSGTEVSFVEQMPEWDYVLRDFQQQLGKVATPPPVLASIDCTEQQMREFAKAAAAYYRSRLWELLDDNDLIQIETPKPPRGFKFATVLGSGGQTYGLGFYQDDEDHYALMAQREDMHEMRLCSLTFDNPATSAPEDVRLWKDLELPLETGDAFPFVVVMDKSESRCLTAKELDTVTIILQTLAGTSEEELDSGRWTKWVQHLGKRRKCKLSIPNLLDPPDHQEWIRRGKIPEQRGHEGIFSMVQEFIDSNTGEMSLDELNEALNENFTGPIDQLIPTANTPEQRAEALCQEAIQAFGRRRIQLMRQALEENPNHVEANILLAESTRNVERAAELFRHAKQIGKEQLESQFDELSGEFWGFHETRPYMRASHGLASTLQKAGQTKESICEYQEMLRQNPDDNQGVRYELAPLLLTMNREAEAIELLNQYREETAHWAYMKSLVEFRRNGNSSVAKQLMKSAFSINPHVVAMLQSEEPLAYPESYSLGSPEEAVICMNSLSDAWEESEDYVDWMFGEYFIWERDRAKRRRDKMRKQRKKASGRRGRRK